MKYKVIFSILLIQSLSCDTQELSFEDNKRIREAFENRMKEYRNTLRSECRQATIQQAVMYTDSLIAADYFMELSGTIPFPPKPIKPLFDGPIIIKDTIKASPILQ